MSHGKRFLGTACVVAIVSVHGVGLLAQGPPGGVANVPIVPIGSGPQPAQGTADKTLVPLRLQITISRYENDKRTSSVPFTMWVNANEGQPTVMNSGQQVPIATSTGPTASYTYQNVGTRISAAADRQPDGRFNVRLDISDSSVVPARQPSVGPQPVSAAPGALGAVPTMASLTAANRVLLRDGQTAEFLSATDKITGEVTKIEVTLTVLK